MALDAHEIAAIAVAAVAYFLCTAHLLHFAWACLASSGLRGGSTCRWAAELRGWAFGRGSREESGLDSKIRSLIERERNKCVQTFARPLAHFTALFLVARMFMDVGVAVANTDPNAALSRFEPTRVSRVTDVMLLFILCKLALMFPRRLTSRATSAVFALTCASEVAKSFFLLPMNYVVVEQPFAQGFLLLLGIVACNSRVTVLGTCLVRLTIGIFLHREALKATEGEVLFGMQQRILVQNIALGIGQCLVLICLESAVWTASREVLVGKATLKTGRTARRIVSALCDAVVTLGPDLVISKRAPKLANLLLRGSAARALEGSPFADLLLEGDRARFRGFLERALDTGDEDEGADEPPPAEALQVSLRDGSGIGVRVQLYHSRFRDEDDEIGHLLGICEVGDAPRGQEACRAREARREEPSRTRGAVIRASGGSDMDSDSESSSTLDISASSRRARRAAAAAATRTVQRAVGRDGRGPRQSARELGGEGSPEAWQLLQPEECGIAFETLRFQVGGQQRAVLPAIDASLTDNESLQSWVAEWPSCHAWLQDLTNAALRPIRPASWRDHGNPPAFVRLHVAFQAICAVPQDFLRSSPAGSSRPGGEGGDAQHPPMRLPLGSVRLLKGGLRGAPRAGDRMPGQQWCGQQAAPAQSPATGSAMPSVRGWAGAAAAAAGGSRALHTHASL